MKADVLVMCTSEEELIVIQDLENRFYQRQDVRTSNEIKTNIRLNSMMKITSPKPRGAMLGAERKNRFQFAKAALSEVEG